MNKAVRASFVICYSIDSICAQYSGARGLLIQKIKRAACGDPLLVLLRRRLFTPRILQPCDLV
ncbi:MAG: hypothetical protein RSD82_10960, partial [Comamonas sp.]